VEKLPPLLIPRALLLLRHQRKSTGACCSTMRYAGIRGNSHMLMTDRNNLEVAALIQRWLEKQGLYR